MVILILLFNIICSNTTIAVFAMPTEDHVSPPVQVAAFVPGALCYSGALAFL